MHRRVRGARSTGRKIEEEDNRTRGWTVEGKGVVRFNSTKENRSNLLLTDVIQSLGHLVYIYAVYARLVCIGNPVQRVHCYDGAQDEGHGETGGIDVDGGGGGGGGGDGGGDDGGGGG
ncbi:hypothetical protein ALC60_12982 [Trachymyrmex zeteki]|uniref:Uncharacterized protein n=1 Tax=Mycetomoellerius zeteki TaxID=64791 RepID=A0A151WJI8_9HYME|nr:hypothetical protein ALC60_12982 [Trachymyrmex zeteki]